MGSEKIFENSVRDFLREIGAYNVKYFGCAFSESGVPDVLASYKGTFHGIEIKATGGRPSLLQVVNLIQIHNTGGRGWLLYPEMFDDFKAYFKAETLPHKRLEIYTKNMEYISTWRSRLIQPKKCRKRNIPTA